MLSLPAGRIKIFLKVISGAAMNFADHNAPKLSAIWSVKSKPEKGWVKVLLDRLLSFSLI